LRKKFTLLTNKNPDATALLEEMNITSEMFEQSYSRGERSPHLISGIYNDLTFYFQD
jgi:hypothetical protein